jgi:hypothetical protein
MTSDFSDAWQCLSKRTIGYFVTDQTPRLEFVLTFQARNRYFRHKARRTFLLLVPRDKNAIRNAKENTLHSSCLLRGWAP